jgi:transposase
VDQPKTVARAGCPFINLNPQQNTIKKKSSLEKKAAAQAAQKAADQGEIYRAPKPPQNGCLIGLDCHPDSVTAAVFKGTTPHDARQLCSKNKLSLEQFLEWIRSEFGPGDLFLLEASANSFEIHRRLWALGLQAAVLESSSVAQGAKKYADNDRLAAARIVRVYLCGDAPCVWVPDEKSGERRELLHAQQKAVGDHTATSNAIKGYLNQFTIRLGKRNLVQPATRAWVLKQRAWSSLQREILASYFEQLDQAAKRRKQLTTLIHREVAAEPAMLSCLKLLGLGTINAFALLAIIGDIRRFARPENLVAYIGLNPGQRESGTGKRIKLGIGHHGRRDLRSLLIQGAQAVLRSGRHTALGQWGWKVFAKKGHRNIAVCAVARKLVVQVWHLLCGHPPKALEASHCFSTKLRKLAVALGQKLRLQLGLPASLAACIVELQTRTLAICPAPL